MLLFWDIDYWFDANLTLLKIAQRTFLFIQNHTKTPYPFLSAADRYDLSLFDLSGAADTPWFMWVVLSPAFYSKMMRVDATFRIVSLYTAPRGLNVPNKQDGHRGVPATWSSETAVQGGSGAGWFFIAVQVLSTTLAFIQGYYLGKAVGWDDAQRAAKEKHETKADLSFDYDFITALTEQDTVANLRYGILFLLALSSLGVYSIILAGWSSNSKYAFIGALRSAAQMISYEVAISLIILPVVLASGSLNLSMVTYVQHITTWFLWPLLPVALLFLVAMLAETNRTPFDLPEAEAELVAGYNVDYSSLPFAMFFLGEYCNMILISTLYCLLFLSGGLNTLGLSSALLLSAKAAVTWVFFVLVRATLPRYRYDQLMDIGWKVFLPVSGSFLIFVFGILVYFSALPVANELPLNFRLPAQD